MMFDMMGAVAPVDKNSLEVICALQLLRIDVEAKEKALQILKNAERSKIMASTEGAAQDAALKEIHEIFEKKFADNDRIWKEKQRKIYIKASGKYAKIALSKR